MSLTWCDAEAVATALRAAHPAVDPITVRFIDLERWPRRIAAFAAVAPDPEPEQLEDIQAEWYKLSGRR